MRADCMLGGGRRGARQEAWEDSLPGRNVTDALASLIGMRGLMFASTEQVPRSFTPLQAPLWRLVQKGMAANSDSLLRLLNSQQLREGCGRRPRHIVSCLCCTYSFLLLHFEQLSVVCNDEDTCVMFLFQSLRKILTLPEDLSLLDVDKALEPSGYCHPACAPSPAAPCTSCAPTIRNLF